MTPYYILPKNNLQTFLDTLEKEYAVFIPVKKGEHRSYRAYQGSLEGLTLGEVRTFEPLKAFFSRAREQVAKDFDPKLPWTLQKPLAIVGAKACDLKGFKIQDFVFADPQSPDPAYTKNRTQNLIISADCTCAIETCFCLALEVSPYPKDGFDLNFSDLGDEIVVEVGSPKGKDILAQQSAFLRPADDKHLVKREEQRRRVSEQIEDNIKESLPPRQDRYKDIIKTNFDAPLWSEEAKTCVECGACNTICPTCHCFLLADQADAKHFMRYRLWDSCMIKDFARVAGGGNPRKKLWMRLRNRFEKKFDYFPGVSGLYACTGCGRCISACPAKIDIRKVLRRLVDHV